MSVTNGVFANDVNYSMCARLQTLFANASRFVLLTLYTIRYDTVD